LEQKPSFRTAILYHSPNPGFKKELISFVNELQPEERFWGPIKKFKLANERGQLVYSDVRGPTIETVLEYWKI